MALSAGLILIFTLVPLTAILLVIWLITKNRIFGQTIGLVWLAVSAYVIIAVIFQSVNAKKELKRKDYYGNYIVNRNYFAGKQARGQYETYRFEIKDNDSIYFYVTDKKRILKTYRGTITTTKPHSSERLVIKMEQPTHHILTSNPTIYRTAWSFHVVFFSPKFKNVFFKKGNWEAISAK